MCGLLQMSMYGTRDAAQNWEMKYTSVLKEMGFTQGRSNPCVFKGPRNRSWIVVHGDDFTVLAEKEELVQIFEEMSRKLIAKNRGILGPDGDNRSVRILNRIVEWTGKGLKYEADQRHADIIVRELGLSGSRTKPVGAPGWQNKDQDNNKEELK